MTKLHQLIPASERSAILKRLLIVWAVAAVIGLAMWAAQGFSWPSLAKQMIYSYAISTCIWFLSDVVCLLIFRQNRLQSTRPIGRGVFFAFSIVLGYVAGTFIADTYTGWSSWEFFSQNLGRLTGMLLMSVVISIGFSVFFYQSERFEHTKRQAIDAKLKLLESQLEPHMLFNTLANLRHLIGTDTARAIDMLDKLNSYLRATLSGSRQSLHTLSSEFERLRDYLALMKVRMGDRLQYQLDLPNPLAQQLIPPLLLQPLVENAIKHGLEPAIKGGQINISVQQIKERLSITIQDTGVGGLTQQHLANAPGFGLTHVLERLQTTYGQTATITINASKDTPDTVGIANGTTIQIQLPMTQGGV